MFPVNTAVNEIQNGRHNSRWLPKISEMSMLCFRMHTYCNVSCSGVKGIYDVLGPLFILLNGTKILLPSDNKSNMGA